MSDRLRTLATQAETVPYHATLGIRVDELAADRVRVRIPYADDNSNPGRALHGGVYASAIDAAGVLAAWSGIDDATGDLPRSLHHDLERLVVEHVERHHFAHDPAAVELERDLRRR